MGETIKSQRTFSIREPDKRNARSIRKTVLHYKHVENMLTLLVQEELNRITAHADRGWSLFNDLTNPQIMKGVLTSNQGGAATRDGIARVNHALGHHELLKTLKAQYEWLNDKQLSMMVREVSKNWKNYFLACADYRDNPDQYTSQPNPPKAKRLQSVTQWAMAVEESKWSLKRKNQLRLTLGKKRQEHLSAPSRIFKDLFALHRIASHQDSQRACVLPIHPFHGKERV